MIDVDNQEYSHEDCREPDLQDIIDHDQGYDEYKEKRAGFFDEMERINNGTN